MITTDHVTLLLCTCPPLPVVALASRLGLRRGEGAERVYKRYRRRLWRSFRQSESVSQSDRESVRSLDGFLLVAWPLLGSSVVMGEWRSGALGGAMYAEMVVA